MPTTRCTAPVKRHSSHKTRMKCPACREGYYGSLIPGAAPKDPLFGLNEEGMKVLAGFTDNKQAIAQIVEKMRRWDQGHRWEDSQDFAKVIASLASNKNIDAELAKDLAVSDDWRISSSALQNPVLDSDFLYDQVAALEGETTTDARMRVEYAILNPNATPEVMDAAARTRDKSILSVIARSDKMSEDCARYIYEGVKSGEIGRSHSPTFGTEVVSLIAKNPVTPKSIIGEICRGDDKTLRHAAAENPQIDAESLEHLVEKDGAIALYSTMRVNKSIPPHILYKTLSGEYEARGETQRLAKVRSRHYLSERFGIDKGNREALNYILESGQWHTYDESSSAVVIARTMFQDEEK